VQNQQSLLQISSYLRNKRLMKLNNYFEIVNFSGFRVSDYTTSCSLEAGQKERTPAEGRQHLRSREVVPQIISRHCLSHLQAKCYFIGVLCSGESRNSLSVAENF